MTDDTSRSAAPSQALWAAVDLGSNSFRLQICQNNNGQLQVVDSIKEMVRLAAGLDDKKYLDEASRRRALSCLSKFGERLRGFSAEQVRAVATNTFRVAKHIAEFIPQAEAALGFPIEIIAGREEARLIYTGVVHTLPPNGDKMLVVDIGGGSTEFVIGSDIQPMRAESLPLGCVTYSMRFFQNKIDEKVFQTAITAARTEIQRIAKAYKDTGWDFAVGTSGSAKSIRDVLAAETGNTEETISYPGMKKLMQRICEAGSVKKAKFAGLKADRLEVFAGGLAVMLAVFEELGVQTMTVTDAALRDGVFYDFIGRSLNEDMREQTVTQFQQRYHVSLSQADRVAHTASILLESLAQNASVQELNHWRQYLRWAAKLHEIGIDIAYTAYHKHTAYILDQADMPAVWSLLDAAIVMMKDRPLFRATISSKTFEALAMGMPVIMSLPAGEATGLVDEYGFGINVLPENPEDMANAIQKLADDPALTKALGQKALEASRDFSRERSAGLVMDVVQDVMAERRPGDDRVGPGVAPS